MESKDFYNQAIKLMNDIKNIEPQLVSGSDSELCVLTTDKQTVYAGITSVKINDGKIMRACPEFNAIMTMIASGEITVEKLITISFSTKEVNQPCPECIKLLCDTSPDNKDTEIYVSPNQFSKASELLSSDTPIMQEEKSAPAKADFTAVSEVTAPESMINKENKTNKANKASKNPLPSANDFAGFATEGDDFGFEAAETPEEPEEQEQNEFEDKATVNQDNPFYAPPTMQAPAPTTMQQQSYQQQSIYQQQPYQQPPYQQQSPYSQQASMPNSYYYNQPQQAYPQYQQPAQNSYYYNQPQGQQSIYMQPQGQQSVYMQPQGQQSVYMQPQGQQSVYMQPQGQQSMYLNQPTNHSQTVSSYYGQPQPVSKNPETSVFKNRLANFMDDETGITANPEETQTLSKAEMLKQAKEKKKLAKMEAKKRGK